MSRTKGLLAEMFWVIALLLVCAPYVLIGKAMDAIDKGVIKMLGMLFERANL